MAKACVLFMEGTNCEDETRKAFLRVGIDAELVHLKQLTGEAPRGMERSLSDFDVLMIPGGWSAGDYVRAGAIFAARMKSKLLPQIKEFVSEGKLVGGICNGFQVLTEFGLLPGFAGTSDVPEAALTNNADGRFQCRPTYLKHTSPCAFTEGMDLGTVLQVPVAHAEGRFTFGEKDGKLLQRLLDNDQVVFRYCMPDGSEAKREFPWNPNGSLYDIAGICNPEGNVLGMMPHPERVLDSWQQADWTRKEKRIAAGTLFFESVAEYLKRRE